MTITEQTNDLCNKACALNDMAGLYCKRKRLEEALSLYRLAINCYIDLQDLDGEILSRGNLANLLIEQQRYTEARNELNHLFDYMTRADNFDEPWQVFHSLYELEKALGNAQMAAQARQQSIDTYLYAIGARVEQGPHKR